MKVYIRRSVLKRARLPISVAALLEEMTEQDYRRFLVKLLACARDGVLDSPAPLLFPRDVKPEQWETIHRQSLTPAAQQRLADVLEYRLDLRDDTRTQAIVRNALRVSLLEIALTYQMPGLLSVGSLELPTVLPALRDIDVGYEVNTKPLLARTRRKVTRLAGMTDAQLAEYDMNEMELMQRVARQAHVTQDVVDVVIAAAFAIIMDAVAKQQAVVLRDFGTFTATSRRVGTRRENMCRTPQFQPAPKFREAVKS